MMTLLESQHIQLEQANEKLESLIDTDVLTHVGNRRSFLKVIANTHLLSLRYNRPYSILICDIDDFKMYNDTYGHQMGDYVLIAIANKIKNFLRESDHVFRWGGEEFAVILPEQNIQDAMNVAENLRSEIQALAMEVIRAETESKVVTISIGVACINNCDSKIVTWEEVFKMADDALYKAKEDGRNCISVFQ